MDTFYAVNISGYNIYRIIILSICGTHSAEAIALQKTSTEIIICMIATNSRIANTHY